MKLITITGNSGAGKDTVARMLSEITGIEVLCSFTTRPMREGEVDGREHRFVKECKRHGRMLAYTQYGGYEYWTTIDQVKGTAIYVIDEKGLIYLCRRFPEIEQTRLYINASDVDISNRGVSVDRRVRDLHRRVLSNVFFDYIIENRGSVEDLRHILSELVSSHKTRFL